MDPLSIAASIIAILQLSNKVIGYLNDVKEASKERARCAVEATNLHSLLTNLRYRLEDADADTPWFTAIRALAVDKGPFDQFKQTLELLSNRMAGGADHLGKFREALMWKFKKEEMDRMLLSMERLKTLVVIALQMDHFKLSQAIKDDTGFIRDHVPVIHASIETIKQDRDRAQLQKLKAWLSSTDFVSQQSDIFRRRHEGTGQWFLDTPEFAEWLHPSQAGRTLLCTGIPGAGKTMIAAVVIDHLVTKVQSSTIGVAWLYCNYKSRNEQTEHELLAALLKHLVRDETTGVAKVVKELQEQCAARESRPAPEDLKKALQDVLAYYSVVYVVIDALDECSSEDGSRRQLLDHLRELKSCTDVRLMVTSRIIPEIVDEFREAATIEVRAHYEDVTRFVAGQIDRLPRCIQRDAELQKLVQDKITGAIEGMFLLARLYVDALLDKRTKSRVQALLDTLSNGSQTLEKAYEDAIKRLESQLPDDAALATRIISWIVFAERAFTITELRHALAVEMGESSFDPDNILDTEDIVSVCAGLVTVDKKSNIIRLVHYTAHEYFDSIRGNWIPHSQLDITRTCLTYMSFNVFGSGHCSYFTDYKGRLDKYPFLEYAAQYWGRHATSVQDAVFDLVCATILDQGLLSPMSQVLDVSRSRRWLSSHRFPTKINILHMLAYFGLHILAEKLLLLPESNNNYWVTQKDDEEETCLYVAAKYGQDAMVETLLQSGAEINDEVGKLGSVLKIAIHGGHLSTVKILLDNGADINMNDWPGVYGSTALHLASECGNIEMVQLLLDHGADVTARNFDGQTPVEVAAQREMYSIVKLLLDYRPEGVLVTADKPRCTPPLLWVCAYGHSKAVKLFLDQGADVNMSTDQGWTPLHAASDWGHLDVVQTLLDNGADPTLLNDSGQTPLRCALSQNHFSIVELLLSKEVDLDIRGKLARIIMDRASGRGVVTLVRLLLEKGFEVDLTNEHGRTPINNAATTGQLEVFKLLLKHGADFDIPDETGNTPLHNAASCSGCLEVIKLLLEKRAVFSTLGDDMDRHSRNLLHVAAQRGSLDVFLCLKGLGIDPLTKDAKGDGLLSYAASSGSLPVLEAALSTAHVSAVQYEHWSPLHWVCRAGSERLIKRLVLSGLQYHIVTLSQSEDSWSPADVAIHFGHAGMLQDLSDSCKTALGPVAKPERTPGTFQPLVRCDGCFQSIFGPRFKCQTCPDFDYCFMCKPFLGHLHEGHQWEKI